MNVALRRGATQLLAVGSFFTAVLLSNSESIDAQNVDSWAMAALLISVPPVLTLDAVWSINKQRRAGRQLSKRESVLLSISTATVYAVAEFVIAHAFGLEPSTPALIGVPLTILAVSFIGIGLMTLMEARRREDERRTALLEKGIALELARQETGEIVQQVQQALHADIDAALVSARVGLEERLKGQERALAQEHWPAIAQELRTTAEETIRPLSKSLWSRTVIKESRLGILSILHNIVTQQRFRPATVVAVYLIAESAEAITVLGWPVGLASLALGVVLISGVLTLGNHLMKLHPRRHAEIFIGTVMLVEITGLLSFPVRAQWGTTRYTWGEFIASAILGSVVVVASSALGSVRTHRDDLARTFQADIKRELIEAHALSRQVAQLARESARILHGRVQTRLIACAVAIERASTTSDALAFRQALGEAHAALNGPLHPSSGEVVTLLSEVQRKAALWAGLCRIDVWVEPAIHHEPGRFARDIGRVVEEGLSNAVRHGNASLIHVHISEGVGTAVVLLHDNGTGPAGGCPGLGSSLLDALSEDWTLSGSAEGAVLRVVVPTGVMNA